MSLSHCCCRYEGRSNLLFAKYRIILIYHHRLSKIQNMKYDYYLLVYNKKLFKTSTKLSNVQLYGHILLLCVTIIYLWDIISVLILPCITPILFSALLLQKWPNFRVIDQLLTIKWNTKYCPGYVLTIKWNTKYCPGYVSIQIRVRWKHLV